MLVIETVAKSGIPAAEILSRAEQSIATQSFISIPIEGDGSAVSVRFNDIRERSVTGHLADHRFVVILLGDESTRQERHPAIVIAKKR